MITFDSAGLARRQLRAESQSCRGNPSKHFSFTFNKPDRIGKRLKLSYKPEPLQLLLSVAARICSRHCKGAFSPYGGLNYLFRSHFTSFTPRGYRHTMTKKTEIKRNPPRQRCFMHKAWGVAPLNAMKDKRLGRDPLPRFPILPSPHPHHLPLARLPITQPCGGLYNGKPGAKCVLLRWKTGWIAQLPSPGSTRCPINCNAILCYITSRA